MVTAYITAPTDAASHLAELLVEERLAACVNLVECSSVYRWEGTVVTDGELILLAKTTDERYATLRERVLEEHPYEVPCIERFDETGSIPAFAAWREQATTPE
jgi:periplasmic divalent cation tolerance protein